MTKRQAYLKALRNEYAGGLVWAPNFDYWLNVNKAEGTLPEKYEGMGRNDIVRDVGGTIWARAAGLREVYDKSVEVRQIENEDGFTTEIRTPLGNLMQTHVNSEGPCRSKFLKEHHVKTVDDLKIMKYFVDATHYEPDYAPAYEMLRDVGEDGIVLNSYFCVPFIQFAKTDVGYINAYYMWMDARNEVDSLIEAYLKKFLEGYAVLAGGPADVVATGDNMDGTMITPDIFKEYAVPFYQEAKKIIAGKGKVFEGHWCGRTQNLLGLVPGCGLDVVEAIVTKPMADITVIEALDKLQGRVVMQGGIPAVLVCEEGGTREEFETYLKSLVEEVKGRRGFTLGMGDNVPPNADFARVEAVAKIIGGASNE